MVLYNVTIVLEPSIKADWLQWMRATHIPAVMATGCFKEYKMSQVIDDRNPDQTTFAIQYLCESHEVLNNYQKEHAPALQADHTNRYSGKFGSFRTLLDVIEMG